MVGDVDSECDSQGLSHQPCNLIGGLSQRRNTAGSHLDGPLDLAATAEAVDDQETAKQEAILQQYGFRSAYERTWVVRGTAETLIIKAQVMRSPKQAVGYFN